MNAHYLPGTLLGIGDTKINEMYPFIKELTVWNEFLSLGLSVLSCKGRGLDFQSSFKLWHFGYSASLSLGVVSAPVAYAGREVRPSVDCLGLGHKLGHQGFHFLRGKPTTLGILSMQRFC